MSEHRTALREHTHARVLAAAGELFAAHGFAATTIRMIAAAAGTSVGTVMAVGDKDGLLVRIFDERIAAIHAARTGPPAERPTAEQPRAEQPRAEQSSGSGAAAAITALLLPFVELFTADAALARHYAAILVGGRHTSAVFAELGQHLRAEIAEVLHRAHPDQPAEAHAGLAAAIHFTYLGILFDFAGHPALPVPAAEDAAPNTGQSAPAPDQPALAGDLPARIEATIAAILSPAASAAPAAPVSPAASAPEGNRS